MRYSNPTKIVALYVETNGPYFNQKNIYPWDKKKDARNYKGPHRVIAHPPCERWGRYWPGGPSVKVRKLKGADEGCFAHALWAVRSFGGVLEHPEASHAWAWFGLNKPPKSGYWIKADNYGGHTCCVEQGHYGHKGRKATWLYAVNCNLDLKIKWGKSKQGIRADEGFHSIAERQLARKAGKKPIKRLSKNELIYTPEKFMHLLIRLVNQKHQRS